MVEKEADLVCMLKEEPYSKESEREVAISNGLASAYSICITSGVGSEVASGVATGAACGMRHAATCTEDPAAGVEPETTGANGTEHQKVSVR